MEGILDIPAASLALTLALGFAAGFLLRRLGVPAGGLIGPFFAVAALSVLTGLAWLPGETRIGVQIVAGAFVGCSIQRSELGELRKVAKPAALMLGWYLVFVLALGFLLAAVTPLSLATALMSCVPGGISDVPIVAAGMGANTADVTLLQLVRLILGMGLLYAAAKLGQRAKGRRAEAERFREAASQAGAEGGIPSGLIPEMGEEASRVERPRTHLPKPTRLRLALQLLATLAVATIGGLVGALTGVPGMTFTLSIAVTLAFNLFSGFTFMPKWLKRLVQYTAGTYLGCQVSAADLAGIGVLLLPAAIILAAYTASFFALGWLERRFFGFGKTEGRLIAVPAGAADIALVLEDLGIRDVQVVLVQIVRLIAVLALFPQVINVVLLVAG